MNIELLIAIIVGLITILGWIVNYNLQKRHELYIRKLESSLKHVEKQLEELYGPLLFLIYESEQNFKDLLIYLGRNYVFKSNEELSKEDLKTWLFWTENTFLPTNVKIADLLNKKTHLIDDSEFPQSYEIFLKHHYSWSINHLRWKQEGVKYIFRSNINWPTEFTEDIKKTYTKLKNIQYTLIGKISDKRKKNI